MHPFWWLLICTLRSESTVTTAINPDYVASLVPFDFGLDLKPFNRNYAFHPNVDDAVHHLRAKQPDSVPAVIREKHMLLGGPYDPFFDYQLEIIGHLRSLTRCFICLGKEGPKNTSVVITAWSMCFCHGCFEKYAISTYPSVLLHGLLILMIFNSYPSLT